MIQVNGENTSVVRMACSYLFRLKPESDGSGKTINRDQLRAAVRKHYLEGKWNGQQDSNLHQQQAAVVIPLYHARLISNFW